MKPNLDTGVEVYDTKVKKKQRHTTNEKPNMYLDIINESLMIMNSQYFVRAEFLAHFGQSGMIKSLKMVY